ncbi:hypothetical protein CC85DRAFT_286537 [Cutaneotrichosporon oleaginosum]|uniref:Uncharacterized protein n=1 Tax=Cutaneotrichosporon oleaginosum TaxID=879819 RepID=A0A0J1B192_9TREE|nr:uncharacterized protein CC85DRAFT_286537 [Cutaneotrichosporon oleaginosum]KLT41364.1 hypothetical protein CC85DRAFT_286537 [Cutaneotrichosporon oleaginosum]TXT06306.1 hypothetical protein COLE_05637 [Cutaneotrichosporon oleaginosum]
MPPTPPEPQRLPLPPKFAHFPRQSWDGSLWGGRICFGWPDFAPSEYKLMAMWAGRAASLRVTECFEKGDPSAVTDLDFCLAVLDKTFELKWYFEDVFCSLGREYTTDEWIAYTNTLIGMVYTFCCDQVDDRFPNNTLTDSRHYPTIFYRIREELSGAWVEGNESWGSPPPIDHSYTNDYLLPYLPDRSTLPPRPFRILDESADVIWLDVNGEEIAEPTAEEQAAYRAQIAHIRIGDSAPRVHVSPTRSSVSAASTILLTPQGPGKEAATQSYIYAEEDSPSKHKGGRAPAMLSGSPPNDPQDNQASSYRRLYRDVI